MSPLRSLLALSASEQEQLLETAYTMQVASIGRNGYPHLVAMFYAIVDGRICFHTYPASQKIKNLNRNQKITVMLEQGKMYSELRGLVVQGMAEVIEDQQFVGRVVLATAKKYFDFPASVAEPPEAMQDTARKRVAVRVRPASIYSWDHAKLTIAH